MAQKHWYIRWSALKLKETTLKNKNNLKSCIVLAAKFSNNPMCIHFIVNGSLYVIFYLFSKYNNACKTYS